MTCEEFGDMAAAYALALVNEAERTACMRHLAQSGPHRGCTEAVGEAQQVSEHLSVVVAARAPSPGVWRAIEARIADLPAVAVDRRRRVREVGGWLVATAVLAFYLFSPPHDAGHRAEAIAGGRTMAREALGLMTAPGTRIVPFSARKDGAGRATLLVNPVQHRALLLAEQIPPEAAQQLRLWGAWGPSVPTPIAPVIIAGDGIAIADVGAYLFQQTPPDQLVLSADSPGATSPANVLLTAETRSR